MINVEAGIEQLLQQIGYKYVGYTETIYREQNCCSTNSEINVKLTLLEAQPGVSYFLIIPLKIVNVIGNNPTCVPVVAPCITNTSIKVTGIRQLSSDVQQKTTIINYSSSSPIGTFDNYCNQNYIPKPGGCDTYNREPPGYETITLYAGDSYYAPPNAPFPMLVYSKFDKLELEVSLHAQYPTGSATLPWTETFLEISNIKVYQLNQDEFLNELGLVLTLLGFVLGLR